ncbi:MAG: choice-of-anchor J domain-containing protein, partial [Anaerolineales bacterium]|nr:choice-of-anchor J domain-containing protein [Anaerolineales bacterium]
MSRNGELSDHVIMKKRRHVGLALLAILISALFATNAASHPSLIPPQAQEAPQRNPILPSNNESKSIRLEKYKLDLSSNVHLPRSETFQPETKRSPASIAPQAIPCLGTEDFEGEFPPDGWTLYKTGDSADPGWQQTSLYAYSGSYSAFHIDADLNQPAISWMVTPRITATAQTELTFWQSVVYWNFYEYHGIWISTGSSDPNDGDYIELIELVPTEANNYNWVQETIDLSAYAGQAIYLAFRYVGDYNTAWFLDDITVTGCALSQGLYLWPDQLVVQGCGGIPQTHQISLANWTGSDTEIQLSYQPANPAYGSISGPASIELPSEMETGLTITITPNLCLPDSLQFTGTVEAAGNGYTDTLQLNKTIHTGLQSEWEPVQGAPQATRFHAVAYHDGAVYQIGGETGWWTLTDSVYRYDVANDSWASSASMITGAFGIDAVVIGDMIYVPGGNISQVDANLAGPRLDALQVYSTTADSWSLGPPMPVALAYASAVAFEGKLYVIGGEDAAGNYGDTLYQYDPSVEAWQQKSSMSQARGYAAAAVIDGQIYVAGGFDGTNTLHSTEIYSPTIDTWSAGPDLPKDWAPFADGALGDRYLLLLNGDVISFDEDSTAYSCSEDAYVLDTVLGEWFAISSLDRCLYGAQGAGDLSQFFLVSGRTYETYWYMTAEVNSFSLCPTCEQTGYLEGLVTDYDGINPTCTGSILAIEPGAIELIPGADGSYRIALPPLDYMVSASSPDYPLVAGPISAAIFENNVTELDFILDRPDINQSSTSIKTSAIVSSIVTEHINIENQGSYTLTFQTREIPPAGETRSNTPFHAEIRTVSGDKVQVEDALQTQIDRDGQAGLLIVFNERPDLTPALTMDWAERGWFVANSLKDTADRSQASVRAFLDANNIAYQSFWIENVIAVESSDRKTLTGLEGFSEIASIKARRTMHLIEPTQKLDAASRTPTSIEPNLTHVGVDQVWQMGFRGENMVVANIDTGVRFTHETLVNHYRGNLGGGSFNHDYNWLDPTTNNTVPTDDHGHGSHTMGAMVGDDNNSNQIGMAPGAEWIACDACTTDGCYDVGLLTCAQWMVAPYPIGQPSLFDPEMRPHVVNNSWGDCLQQYDGWFQDAVDAWHAAGIYPVFSNGNAS